MIAVKTLLLAIALVESGGNPHAVGQLGERGSHQLMPAVAAHFTPAGYEAECERMLRAHGIEVTPQSVACLWNAGPTRYFSGRIKPASWEYSLRVQNLYTALSHHEHTTHRQELSGAVRRP